MTSPFPFRRFRIFTAILVMLQLVFVQAMAADGDLHHRCHDHAGDPGHECAVTLMLSGGYDLVVPDIKPVEIAPEPPTPVVEIPVTVVIQPSHLAGGVLAHAPPRGP